MSATMKLGEPGDPCPVCGVVPFGANAEAGCRGCHLHAEVNRRLSACFARAALRHGRKVTEAFRREVEDEAMRIIEQIDAEH